MHRLLVHPFFSKKGETKMEYISKNGWIEAICGPMFAGKSEELIRRIRRLEYAKQSFLVFKPTIDIRYSKDMVESHLHNKAKCITIKSSSEILKYVKPETKAVVIDEVQFLDAGVVDVCDYLANSGVRVIVGGL